MGQSFGLNGDSVNVPKKEKVEEDRHLYRPIKVPGSLDNVVKTPSIAFETVLPRDRL
jgi:hypothetical protein